MARIISRTRSRPARSRSSPGPRRWSRARSISPTPNPRRAFAQAAAKFFAPFPDTVVAVTGTNGKTSTVELTRQLWRMAGYHAASIGTLGVTTADDSVSTGLTTPDIVTFLVEHGGAARARASPMSRSKPPATASRNIAPRACRVKAARLHQSDPRPSRLSRHDGGLSRGQAAPVQRGGRARRRRGGVDGRSRLRRASPRSRASAGSRDHGGRAGRDAAAGRTRRRPSSARR